MAVTFTQGVSEVIGTASQLSGAVSDPVTATQVTSVTSTQITGQMTASQGGTALTTIGTNQVPMGNSAGAFAGGTLGERLLSYATNLVLTASGDVLLTMSNAANLGSYIVRRVSWGLPVTAALATVVVVATVRTASNGGGSAITGSLVVTGLSATTAYLDQTVTLASAVTTSTQLFVNVTTAAATAPSSQIFIYGASLGV